MNTLSQRMLMGGLLGLGTGLLMFALPFVPFWILLAYFLFLVIFPVCCSPVAGMVVAWANYRGVRALPACLLGTLAGAGVGLLAVAGELDLLVYRLLGERVSRGPETCMPLLGGAILGLIFGLFSSRSVHYYLAHNESAQPPQHHRVGVARFVIVNSLLGALVLIGFFLLSLQLRHWQF